MAIEATGNPVIAEAEDEVARAQLEEHFERIAALLRDVDVDRVWEAADDQERRVLVEEQWSG